MDKIRQLQQALLRIGAYDSQNKNEVDGKMGARTRRAINTAKELGYTVDIDRGTVTRQQRYSPEVNYLEHGTYNPFLGGYSFGGGYVAPTVTVTATSHREAMNRRARERNRKTREEARAKRQADKKMQSIEGNIDFATARGQQHNVTEQERVTPNVGRFGPVQQYVKDIVQYATAKENKPDIVLTNGDFSDSYNKDASRLAQIAYRQYVRSHGYPTPGTTIPFSLEPSVYKEINKDGRYAHFTIPNIINAALGGSNQVEFTDGGMSGSAYINPETNKVDVHWTDRTAWDLTDRERQKFQSEGGVGNHVRLFMEKVGSKGEDSLPDYVQSLRYSIPYDTISGDYRGRLRKIPAYY